jgi:hypothetical protein
MIMMVGDPGVDGASTRPYPRTRHDGRARRQWMVLVIGRVQGFSGKKLIVLMPTKATHVGVVTLLGHRCGYLREARAPGENPSSLGSLQVFPLTATLAL